MAIRICVVCEGVVQCGLAPSCYGCDLGPPGTGICDKITKMLNDKFPVVCTKCHSRK